MDSCSPPPHPGHGRPTSLGHMEATGPLMTTAPSDHHIKMPFGKRLHHLVRRLRLPVANKQSAYRPLGGLHSHVGAGVKREVGIAVALLCTAELNKTGGRNILFFNLIKIGQKLEMNVTGERTGSSHRRANTLFSSLMPSVCCPAWLLLVQPRFSCSASQRFIISSCLS